MAKKNDNREAYEEQPTKECPRRSMRVSGSKPVRMAWTNGIRIEYPPTKI